MRGLASDQQRAVGRDRGRRGEKQLARRVSLRLERAPQSADAVACSLDDEAMTHSPWLWLGRALEVRMELEAVHREFAMAFEEAEREGSLAQHALDADCDLGFVGALDEDAAARSLDDRGVVELDALAARKLRLLVGIDRRGP